MYEAFPNAKPDDFFYVDEFRDILEQKNQDALLERNVIIIPHGSFVEYVGPKNLEDKFRVPMFGNRKTLAWEGDRRRQRMWLEKAGLKMPKEFSRLRDARGKMIVKFQGAKGGRGFFLADSAEEAIRRLEAMRKKGNADAIPTKVTAQEFVSGVRYYPHYFYSLMERGGAKVGKGRVELLSMDKRVETIDEAYRGLPSVPEEFFDYTVSGNLPLVIRESLLPDLVRMGKNVVDASIELFAPGMIGPFCLETIYHPKRGFTVFEVSARIVAGTNLFPMGSPYSVYLFDEPMSTGRRIARELLLASKRNALQSVVY